MKPIFVLGCPNSGTTVVQEVLNSHKEICVEFELGWIRLWEIARLACFDQASFHKQYQEELTRSVDEVFRQGFYDRYPKTLKYGGEKYPSLIVRIPWIRAVLPESRFIICTREREATIASMMKNAPIPKEQAEQAYDMAKKAGDSQMGEPDCFYIKLEELRRDKVAVLTKLAKWLGVENTFDASLVKAESHIVLL